VARIVIAGAGAIGASIAYHLALRGARDVVLADRGEVAGGATSKAMGGVRQQFSTAPEVTLAKESIEAFEALGAPSFLQVGYLFLATTERGLAELESRRETQVALGVPVERVDRRRLASLAPGVRGDDVVGGVFCGKDGVADPPAVAREWARRAAEKGVTILERTDARTVEGEIRVIACAARSPEQAAPFGVDLPVRPLCRQLLETADVAGLPDALPMVIEAESGFHFRRRADRLVIAMTDPAPRWGFDEMVDESLLPDRLARLAARFPAAAGTRFERAWAGLYDMTPDAHPILGRVAERVYVACGFSGHGFMQSPAVGRAIAEEILDGRSTLDLSPFRLDRFAKGVSFAETVVL